MRSIGAKFTIAVGVLATIFSGVVLYRAWSSAKTHTEELTAVQAELALEFDLALREYAGESIRPEVAKLIGEDEFIVEAMSTSHIARSVFEKVQSKFPDHVIKFPSDNPRNPVNKAGPEELNLIEYFRDNPQASRWNGTLDMNGSKYLPSPLIGTGCLLAARSDNIRVGLPSKSATSAADLHQDETVTDLPTGEDHGRRNSHPGFGC